MKAIQRAANIYKSQSQLSHQNNSNSTFGYSSSSRNADLARPASDSGNSFDKILREQMAKKNNRLSN